MKITVYSKPNCVQCTQTKRILDLLELKYETVDITENTEAFNFVYNMGYRQAPVVIVKDENGNITDHWSGFNPEQIKEVGKE
jgi:glutaredoxin-like protein NrdH